MLFGPLVCRLTVCTIAIFSLLFMVCARPAAAVDYFVSPTGMDIHDGMSTGSPWRTLARVSTASFHPGDRVLLQGGETFPGTLTLHSAAPGTAARPIAVASYGKGRATIAANSGDGIEISDTGAVTISDLILTGRWDASTQSGSSGSGITLNSDVAGIRISDVRLTGLDVSGFKTAGIVLYAYPKTGISGFDHIRITDCAVHDNGNTGIETFGNGYPDNDPFTHLYIARCRVYNNRGVTKHGNPKPSGNSGSGILLSGVNGAMVERCVAHDNGNLEGGGCGIWCYDSHAVIFQYNESYDNSTSSTNSDGDGFDLDGGVTNSVVQYNYAHGNTGAGILVWEFSKQGGNHDNTIRDNICQGDATHGWYGEIDVGGNPMSGIHVYNNTVYATPEPGPARAAIRFENTTASDFRNNLIISTQGIPLITGSTATFQGNDYWSSGGKLNLDGSSSLDNFRKARGQEVLNGKPTGLNVNPQLINPGGGPTLGDAGKLSRLRAYRLRPNSPLLHAGLPLKTLFGEDAGATDFYGAPLSRSGHEDIGAASGR
jgi:hypothetical protein